MSTAIVRPPSQRNSLVHYFLQEGGTTREAAARFGISQTRVRQVERQVVRWAAYVLPVESEAEAAGLARVAQSVAADRLEHFYQQSMREWNATHQPKFLNLALRVTMATVRLPGRAYEIGAAEAELLEPEEERGVGGRGTGVGGEDMAKGPPSGACSGNDEAQAESLEVSERRNVANRSSSGISELLRTAASKSSAAHSALARSLLSAGDGQAVTRLRLTPDEPGASIERVHSPPPRELTRQERRRLQKKLKRERGLA